jgi:peptidoglycan/xylan/chitin deacetylase (PgdA/CDA1 family)
MCIDWYKVISGEAEIERWPDDIGANDPVPDFSYNILNEKGVLHSPEYDLIRLKNNKIKKPVWPNSSPFAVCLTHDLDHISKGSILQTIRLFKKIINCKNDRYKQLKIAVRSIFDFLLNFNRNDPFHSIDCWTRLEDKYGVRSTFFIMSEVVNSKHFSDGCYKYSDKVQFEGQETLLKDILCNINSKGWEIGLHPSWHAYNNLDEMELQKNTLEAIIKRKVVSVRQHFLHYDYRITPEVQRQAGFLYDATLGYNCNIGFRNGTSYPFYLNPLDGQRKSAQVLQIPLIIQDVALMGRRKGLGLSVEKSIELIGSIADKVSATGGVLTLSWHPNVWEEDSWVEVYSRAIKMLKERGAWFGTIEEVGSVWNKENQ